MKHPQERMKTRLLERILQSSQMCKLNIIESPQFWCSFFKSNKLEPSKTIFVFPGWHPFLRFLWLSNLNLWGLPMPKMPRLEGWKHMVFFPQIAIGPIGVLTSSIGVRLRRFCGFVLGGVIWVCVWVRVRRFWFVLGVGKGCCRCLYL